MGLAHEVQTLQSVGTTHNHLVLSSQLVYPTLEWPSRVRTKVQYVVLDWVMDRWALCAVYHSGSLVASSYFDVARHRNGLWYSHNARMTSFNYWYVEIHRIWYKRTYWIDWTLTWRSLDARWCSNTTWWCPETLGNEHVTPDDAHLTLTWRHLIIVM